MISSAKVAEIRALLDAGELSQRQIATLAGVSRGTIGAIASGKRVERLPRPTDEWEEEGPIVRCPGCGGKVYAPCRLCRVRDDKQAEIVDRRQQAGRRSETRNEAEREKCDPTQASSTPRRR
jgi:hypothetical protein